MVSGRERACKLEDKGTEDAEKATDGGEWSRTTGEAEEEAIHPGEGIERCCVHLLSLAVYSALGP